MALNPFERFDLDIAATLPDLTRALRERIEDAQTEDERQQLREIWEALTGKLETRAALVLDALPKLARPLPDRPAPAKPAAPPPHPLDTKALPPFPLEWDALPQPKRPEPGRIDLRDDDAFSHLAQVVIP